MDHNIMIDEKLIYSKLAALRAEGMRSQMLAQAGLNHHEKLHFPDFRRLLHRMLVGVTNQNLRRTDPPGSRKTLAN